MRIRTHGQVANDVDMERVLLVQPNTSQKAVVKDSQSGGQPKSFTMAELCFSPREDLHGKFLNLRRRANTCGLLHEPNLTATLLGFNFHGYHIARFLDVVIHVSVYQCRF